MRVADYIVEIFKTEGVRFVTGIMGVDLLDLFDALYDHPEIPLILPRHEQASVFMADGYARSTGEPGVALATKGPGRANTFSALINAFTDCVPLVVIFANSPWKNSGKGVIAEIPALECFASCAKWTFSIPDPDRVPEAYHIRSSIYFVEQINCPLLLLHGEADDVIPVRHTLRLASEMEKLGKPFELEVFENEGHIWTPSAFRNNWRLSVGFFQRHLGSSSSRA